MTRLCARVLLYGPLNAVIHPHTIQPWLDELLAFKPANDAERLGWGYCLAQMARRSGQRVLDVDETHASRVLDLLNAYDLPDDWRRQVREVVAVETEDRSRMFGESLPIGLRFAKD
jgi:hypothetical protein